MIMHIKKSDLIKIIIALEVGAIISTLHTYILNVFFMDVFSANMLLYIKAIINQEPCAVPVVNIFGTIHRYQSLGLCLINFGSQCGRTIIDQHPSRMSNLLQKCPNLSQSLLLKSIFCQKSIEETTKKMETKTGHNLPNQSLNGSAA